MRQGEDLQGCVGFLNEGELTMRNLFLAALGNRSPPPPRRYPPLRPQLARTTWGWVSLTTPEETLTYSAEPERYTLRFLGGGAR